VENWRRENFSEKGGNKELQKSGDFTAFFGQYPPFIPVVLVNWQDETSGPHYELLLILSYLNFLIKILLLKQAPQVSASR